MASEINKKMVYLSTRIDFGMYRECPQSVQQIIDSGERGLNWLKWLMEHSWNFKPAQEVADYITEKELEYGSVLQS